LHGSRPTSPTKHNTSTVVNPSRPLCQSCSGCHRVRSSGQSCFCCIQRTWCSWLSPSDCNHICTPTTHTSLVCVDRLQRCIIRCIATIADWMKSNRLQLNTGKIKFLWCTSARRQHQLIRLLSVSTCQSSSCVILASKSTLTCRCGHTF